MKLAPLACLAVALTAAFIGSATAQTQTRTATVYRCGADGRELRDSPCPANPKADGTQVEFDQPSAAQTRAASERSIADAKRAHALEGKRHQDEAEARRRASNAVGINGLAGPASAPVQAQPPKALNSPKPPKAPRLAKPHKPALAPAVSPNIAPGRSASAAR